MSKRIKMCLYGEPGTGKSVFACKAPKPFFITTDGNYEWLEDFGAKEEDHIQVTSWEQTKKIIKDLATNEYDKYETIVVDLTEDLFKWCEFEFCNKAKIEHVGDMGFGKGYDITRNEFFIELCKIIALDKNVIFIMHGNTFITKDRRGVDRTKHAPTNRLPDKVLDMIEGRVRYFLRCYLKGEEDENGNIIKKRYLSIVPKENEFGIIRGINENTIPQDIPLDWNEFVKTIGFEETSTIRKNRKGAAIPDFAKEEIEKAQKNNVAEIVEEPIEEINTDDSGDMSVKQENEVNINIQEQQVESKEQNSDKLKADKIAEMKAKLAKLKGEN